MRALVTYEPYRVAFEERPIPLPGAGEVRVKTRAIGLCGSDIHLYNGTHPYRTYPLVFGHEVSGWVDEAGEGVSALQRGDHVVLEPLIWCGTCYACSIGRTNCCSRMKTVGVTVPGALADYFVVPARCLHVAPADLAPDTASLTEPFSVGFHATARGGIDTEDQVVVIGAGPIGLAIMAAAQQRGARVAVTDLVDLRLDIARRMGADLTVNSGQDDPVDIVRDWTGGNMASVVVEAVGHPQTIESTIKLVADAGRVVIAGVTERHASLRGVDITKKELAIFGSRNNLGRFKEALQYVAAHPDVASTMVTHHYSFDQAIKAFELTEKHPGQVCKMMLHFEAW